MSLSSGGIEVLRGGFVEARHAVHAVASDAEGRVVASGARRAAEVALIRVLHPLDVLDDATVEGLSAWGRPDVRNTRLEVVGRIQPAFDLSWR
jgi:L-asparaginase II